MTDPAPDPPSPTILVDADACPVKDEVYRVAARFGLRVVVVANAYLAVPRDPLIERVVVGAGFDAADDWIAERAGPEAVVVTADIPLAARCLKAGAAVIAPNGRPFTENSIGSALAGREISAHLRELGQSTGGPRPMTPRDRSAFVGTLDQTIRRLQRRVG